MKRPLLRPLVSLLILLTLAGPAFAQTIKGGSAASASGDAAAASQTGSGTSGGAAPSAITLQVGLTGTVQAGGLAAPAVEPALSAAAAAPAAAAAATVPRSLPVGDISSDADNAAPSPSGERARAPARPALRERNTSRSESIDALDFEAGYDAAPRLTGFFDRAERRGDLDAIHFPNGAPDYVLDRPALSRQAAAPDPIRTAIAWREAHIRRPSVMPSLAARVVGWVKGLFSGQFSNSDPPEAFDRLATHQAQNARLPPRAAELTHLSRLSSAKAESLLEWIKTADIPVDADLPYARDVTFSLELELEVNRQLTDADMKRLFPRGRLTKDEWEDWRLDRRLPKEAWKKAHKDFMSRLLAAIPSGWGITDGMADKPGYRNFIELTTNNGSEKFHQNTPEDWNALVEGLRKVQAVLPGGFYSAHIHIGRKSLTSEGRLTFDRRHFAELYLGFEAFWRGLMGLPYEQLPMSALWPHMIGPGKVPRTNHSQWLNPSDTYPTVENKNVGSLFVADKNGAMHLDPSRLRADLSGSFAFVDMVTRDEALPLASMGLPAVSGVRPGRKQLFHFLDRVYGDDLTGKALALKRLSQLPSLEADGSRSAEMRNVFHELGLRQVYDLHKAHDGWDENLSSHLLEDDGRRLHILARDLLKAGIPRMSRDAHLPKDLGLALYKALEEEEALKRAEVVPPVRGGRSHSLAR